MEKINEKYREICTTLGDIEVKLKGLNNQKEFLFVELSKLDEQAAAAGKEESGGSDETEGTKTV